MIRGSILSEVNQEGILTCKEEDYLKCLQL